MAGWTFITKHAVVLSLIARKPQITAVEMSQSMGVTERAVRKIIADLHTSGYIRKEKRGRGIVYRINRGLPLRQKTHDHIDIGRLLRAINLVENAGEQDIISE